MYDIILSDKATEQLSKLPQKIKNRIGYAIERIKVRPEHFIERLVGGPYYKLRVGDYRIIIDIQKNKMLILIIKIGHRKNIYKK